jgi:DNA-binding response OmpR family regulator
MPAKVLVIDDDVLLTGIFQASLKELFEVYVVNSGREGIQAAREMKPDVIVLDLMMPEMDGWEVCRQIRSFSKVPILVLSAVIDSDLVVKILDDGATDYMVKPIPPGTLVSYVKRLTQQRLSDINNEQEE